MNRRFRAFLAQVAVGVLALFGAQTLERAGALTAFDNHVAAWRAGLSPRPAGDAIVIAALDARSLRQVGAWPWSRTLHAQAIDNLVAAGAEAVLFDIDFSSPSNPKADAALAAALARADGRVTLPVFKQRWSNDTAGPPLVTISRPLPALAEHAWLAGVNVRADADGILRRLPRAGHYGAADADVPSLAAALAEAGPGPPIRVDFSIEPAGVRAISYGSIVDGTFDPARVRGRRVVVGATATELRDDVSVPRHGNLPGVVLHAMGAETVMQDREVHDVPRWRLHVLMAALLLAFAVAGHNAFNVYAFAAFLLASLAALEGLAAFAFVDHAMSLGTGQFHVQALLMAAGVAGTNLEQVRSQLRFAHRDVADGHAMLGGVIDQNPSGILIVDGEGRLLRMNESASAFAQDASDLENWPTALGPALGDALRDAMAQETTASGTVELAPAPHGRIVEWVVAPTHLSGSAAGTVFCVSLNDVTERERAHALARYKAEHDDLTGLRSRYSTLRHLDDLERAAEAEPSPAEPSAVVLFDLDRFHSVNEAHGTDAADGLLRLVAERLKRWADGRFTARLGSDEFLAVVPCADDATLRRELASLRAIFDEPFPLGHAGVTTTATLGVAPVAGGPGAFKRANAALRRAKTTGAAWFVHDDELERATHRHARIDAALPAAVADRQFSLVYQPQLDLRSDTIKGAEALVRWTHPTLGFVSPAEFIPIAESTGQIVTLGRWVMEEACRQAATWPNGASVAVNVSAGQMDDDLVPTIRAALAATGLAPHRLEIELTEGMTVDFARIRPILCAVRSLGVGVAVDDFGTGYSSFAHLREAPFTKIKLDRVFVDGLGEEWRADMLFGSMTTLVADLDMDVLIEGVETAAQLSVVRTTPCHAVQGYHIAKPLDAEAFLAFARDWNAKGDVALSA